eukprot:1159607-Pelagomonas_calceolata.AAC.7
MHTRVHRAVGWHLLTARDKADMDCQALKAHVEEVEGVLEKEKAEWGQKQSAIEQQVAEIKVRMLPRLRPQGI